MDVFTEAAGISRQEIRLVAATAAKLELPIVSLPVVATGLIDFNDPVPNFDSASKKAFAVSPDLWGDPPRDSALYLEPASKTGTGRFVPAFNTGAKLTSQDKPQQNLQGRDQDHEGDSGDKLHPSQSALPRQERNIGARLALGRQ